eukprot:11946979-Alexandrium_andersonii.AAC.1
MKVPHVLDRLADVAEDAVLVPVAPRVDEPLERLVLPELSEVGGVVLGDDILPAALAEEPLALVHPDLGGNARTLE